MKIALWILFVLTMPVYMVGYVSGVLLRPFKLGYYDGFLLVTELELQKRISKLRIPKEDNE